MAASLALSGLLAVDAATPATMISTATASSTTAVSPAALRMGTPPAKGDISSALLRARLAGKRVEVTDARTETLTLWANPDGTLTEDQAGGPVRFRADDGGWTAVDISLEKDADGTVGAKAHPLDLTLGRASTEREDASATLRLRATEPVAAAAPLVSLTSPQGERVELGWRGALPAPTLDGTKATYRDALPHADLVVSATRTGFEQFLVLNSRQAVDEAGTLRMTLTAKGLTAKTDADGGVTFTDVRTGKPAGTLPAPVMWDARTDARSGEHAHRAPVAMSVTQQGDEIDLTLTPDAAFLANPATRFPVTIDPAVGLLTTFTTFVQEGYTTDQSTATELKLGYNGAGQSARSFLRFDTRAVKGKDVKAATLKLWNHHSWSCEPRDWEVWDTSTPSTASRWSAQPSWNRKWATSAQTKGAGTGCADGWATADITALARAWAANAHDLNSLGIRATDEKDSYAWKRFHSRNAATNVPVLSVTYNNPPGAPTAVALSPFSYNTFNKRTYATSVTPIFSAKVADSDGGTVQAQFEVTADPAFNDAGTYSWTGTSGAVASGGTAALALPETKKLGSFGYRVRARAYDGSAYGAWTGHVPFRVNTAKPAAPQINCAGHPQDTWTDTSGEISCTLTTTSTDGRGFLWGLDDPNTPQQVNDPAGTDGKPQTVKINPNKGWHVLHARTVDSAGLLSGVTAHQFGRGTKPTVLPVPDVPSAPLEGAQDTPTPMLSGVLTSGDRAYLHGEFALYDAMGAPLPGVRLPASFHDSGQRVATLIPEGTLVPERGYQWAMRACSDTACSAWTPKRAFTAKAPAAQPVPQVRTVAISGEALRDATAPVGATDCGADPCAAVQDGMLRVGTPGGTAWRSWFKADLSAVPAGVRITDARLTLHRADCAGETAQCTEPAATVRDLAEAWDPSLSGQSLAAAANEEPLLADDELPTALGDLNLGSLVADWLYETDNNGLTLQLGDEKTAAPGVVYHSSRAQDPKLRPVLTVSYIPSGAPGAPENVKAVPADRGLLATWNPPTDPGAAIDTPTYTVVVHRDGTEVARTTTEDTRAVFDGLTNGADHTVTVRAASPHGTSEAAVSAAAEPVAVAERERYVQAVRDYLAARAGVLKGTHTTVEQATASSPHGAMFRALLEQQLPHLNDRREAYARHERRFTEVTTAFDDVLTGPGPDNTVIVRGTVSERSVLTHTDGTQEPEEGPLPGRFVFAAGVLRMEADDAAAEVTLPTTGDAVRDASVAPPAERSVEEVAQGEEDLPIKLDDDGMLADEPAPGTETMRLAAVFAAAPDGNGTANWAKRNANIKYDYDTDCANFVSKALHWGGKMQQRKGGRKNASRWFRNNIGWIRLDSYTWAAAANLRQHLKNHRGGREISRYDARPGDVIFGYYTSSKAWNHTGIVTGGKGDKITITQHGRVHHTTLSQWFKNNKKLSAISIIRPGKRS